jgi:hypothetical protein
MQYDNAVPAIISINEPCIRELNRR